MIWVCSIQSSGASSAVSSAQHLSTSKEPIAVQTKQAEPSKEGLTTIGSGGSESFSPPPVATSSTSTFSPFNFGSPGAGPKPGMEYPVCKY